jgi:hypothetical protein
MTLCPIALAVTCKRCPAFSFCPLKTVIGDEPAAPPAPPTPKAKQSPKGGRKGS